MKTTAEHPLRRHLPGRRTARGVSLVEAMVALAVMAFGMLALVGVQATLRLNTDLAKQRSEATQIATEEVERMRRYAALLPVNGEPGVSWTELLGRTVEAYQPPESIGNTSYRVERMVNTDAATQQKVFQVAVSWTDRTGTAQRVVLDGAVLGAAPELSALLSVPVRPSAVSQVNGRDVTAPVDRITDVDATTSRFLPPGTSTVAWLFNRTTGDLQACTWDGTSTSNCRRARLVSGEVRFHRTTGPGDIPVITAANAENPAGTDIGQRLRLGNGPNAMVMVYPARLTGVTSECYADNPTAAELDPAALPRITAIKYYCALLSGATAGWGGQLNARLLDATGGAPVTPSLLGTGVRVCRYTKASSEFTGNDDHPKTYCVIASTTLRDNADCIVTRVSNNLINQNFLVIPGNGSCPTDTAPNLATGDLLNTNTLPHQP